MIPAHAVIFDKIFQPTLPARGATSDDFQCLQVFRHFNPRSPHGERRFLNQAGQPGGKFQPTLPARGATDTTFFGVCPTSFQPTLPARGATHKASASKPCRAFQPTLPARGATMTALYRLLSNRHFNPRSPHGERRTPGKAENGHEKISTHAPRTGSDFHFFPLHLREGYFNPRSPHGERPTDGDAQAPPRKISTHAPRTGSD